MALNRRKLPLLPAGIALGVILFLPFNEGFARWRDSRVPVPVDRLIKNVGEWIRANPEDPKGYYVLGRLHSMAFALGTKTLKVVLPKEGGESKTPSLPGFHPGETILVRQKKGLPWTPERSAHCLASIRHYGKAAALDPKRAYPLLGLAWVLEQAVPHAPQLGGVPGEARKPEDLAPEKRAKIQAWIRKLGDDDFEVREEATRVLKAGMGEAAPLVLAARSKSDPEIQVRINDILIHWWSEKALEAYRRAYALTVEGDRRKEGFGRIRDYSISLEAGKGIVRLLEKRKPSETELKEIAAVKEIIAELREKPRVVTPIIFPGSAPCSLEALLAPRRFVSFDLDGDGEPGLWPWVKGDTGILVWDPEGRGRIQSGLQLFGSVTWWIFWDHGYEPLRLLDDDGDGWLSGKELKGIAVWFDRNGNGVSEPGEVVPLRDLDIEAIACRFTERIGGCPGNPQGLRRRDGTFLPSYDWTPERVDSSLRKESTSPLRRGR
ncbi:MAG: hypothetical protein ACYTHM_11735 [Planctomycetota bacterium]|jgi:hypothetical protein